MDMASVIFSFMIIFQLGFAIRVHCEKIDKPTLKPANPFSAKADAEVFQHEMQNYYETNDDQLAAIWFHRTYLQRAEIEVYYNSNLCPLKRDDETGEYYYESYCPFRNGIVQLCHSKMRKLYLTSLIPTERILAEVIYLTIDGKWKEVGAIEEAVCANDKEMKDSISKYYESNYKNVGTVDNHLAKFSPEDKDYQNVLRNYCWKGLCQEKKLKPEDVDKEAQALRAINPETDKKGFKKKFMDLLDKNCEPDLKSIFGKYRSDKDCIVDAIGKSFEDEKVKRALQVLTRYIENTCQFYADELEASIKGRDTDYDKINRIILTRCERDLGCITKKYEEIHGKTFTNRLKKDTWNVRYVTSIRFLCGKP